MSEGVEEPVIWLLGAEGLVIRSTGMGELVIITLGAEELATWPLGAEGLAIWSTGMGELQGLSY